MNEAVETLEAELAKLRQKYEMGQVISAEFGNQTAYEANLQAEKVRLLRIIAKVDELLELSSQRESG